MQPSTFGFVLGLGAILTAASSPASAASFLEKNFGLSGPRFDAALPPCNEPAALGMISGRFAAKEGRFWVSNLTIAAFGEIRETAFRPWGRDAIPRRFCMARVRISNGDETTVFYSIAEDTGFIGLTWGVEWCVVGYDRNLGYAPRCKMAQP